MPDLPPHERASRDQRRRRRLLMKLAAEQDDLCFYCDKLLSFPDADRKYGNAERNSEDAASFDHVVPKSRNGRMGANLVIAHRQCNSLRDVNELTEEQTEKLERLNERRAYLFNAESGKTSPTTFGVISVSSIALADKLDDPETLQSERGMICSFIQRYVRVMKSVAAIQDANQWQYVSDLVLTDYLEKLDRGDLLFKTYIASIFKAVRMNQMRKRFIVHNRSLQIRKDTETEN